MEAIILCGGLGTRLGELTRETPKPLIEVAGRPFITHVLDHLLGIGVNRIVLAVSFQWEKLRHTLGTDWRGIPLSYSVELTPMGTGGAIKNAMLEYGLQQSLVVNGDTLLLEDAQPLCAAGTLHDADVVLALKQVEDSGRFGRVLMDTAGRILSFEEKRMTGPGCINAGMYWVNRRTFDITDAQVFSFENEILSKHCQQLNLHGLATDAYFIDMGVPQDLLRARNELAEAMARHKSLQGAKLQ